MISLITSSTTNPITTITTQLVHPVLFVNESQRLLYLCLLLWYSFNGNFQSFLCWPWHLFKIANISSAWYWLKVQSFLPKNHCQSNVVSLNALIVKFLTHSAVFRLPRNRYQRGSQKPLFIEQDIQFPNKKAKTDKQWLH